MTGRTAVALIVLLMGQFVLGSLLFYPVPEVNKEIYYVGVGNVWGMANMIAAYYFTKESKD